MTRIALVAAALGALVIATSAASSPDAPAAPPALRVDDPAPVEATSASGATVSYSVKAFDPTSGNPIAASCDPGGGGSGDFSVSATYAVGDTSVTCTATLEDASTVSKSITVSVHDTVGPVFGSLPTPTAATTESGAIVSWVGPTASDTDGVSEPTTVGCTPASGSSFPIGTTTVSCTATDARGNSTQASFAVVVSDIGDPTISVTPPPTTEATGPGGAAVNYAISASDNSGVPPSVDCGGHGPGSTFPVGTTPVTCTATDGAGRTASTSFSVTVQDTQPPVVSVPGNMTVEAASPTGSAVSFSASANDSVSGAVTTSCSPPSGSTFAIGTATVTCSATDGAGNKGEAGFSITVTDSAGPTFTGVPGGIQVQANGPGGSVVNYTVPSASDAIDGPQLVACNPTSGATFPLGTTTVTCSASDAHGNSATTSFPISVVDTVPPSLVVPAPRSVYATSDAGISDSDPAVTTFIAAASAVDLVDPHPVVTSDVQSVVPVGANVITFIARDASGNAVSRQSTLTVLPVPPPGTPPLPTPPAAAPPQNVRSLKAEAGDARVRLSWQLPAGVDHVVVTRSLTAGGDAQEVYTGKAESFLDRTVVNGLEYRYVVVSFAANGNASAGVAVVALPKASLLRSPKEGARLKKPPKLAWARNAEATYYNVQLFRGEKKILSAWPNRAALTLKRTWKYERRKYTLAPGTYRWYVWPGYGPRSAVDYGEMLGFSTFQIVR